MFLLPNRYLFMRNISIFAHGHLLIKFMEIKIEQIGATFGHLHEINDMSLSHHSNIYLLLIMPIFK